MPDSLSGRVPGVVGGIYAARVLVDRIVAAVFVAALVAEVAYVVDVATHGAVGREVRRLVREAVARVEHERDVQRAARWVVFEAIEATREGAT